MIFNFLILFFMLFYQVFGYFNKSDTEKESPEATLRFANIDLLAKDETLIQFIVFEGVGHEGTKVPHYDTSSVARFVDPDKKTIVLFNGHPSEDSKEPFMVLKDALFQTEDVNVFLIFIDWNKHQISFRDAISLAETFGLYVADMLRSLSIPNNRYHIMAHCAGAEIASTVAEQLAHTQGLKVSRMTVFDPFISNSTRLNFASKFVDLVDVYHAGIYVPPYPPVGHVDFYPNAGAKQPGCESLVGLDHLICHHQRSIYLYVESISHGVNAIESYFSQVNHHLRVKDDPQMATFGHFVDFHERGVFYLPTFPDPPYLMAYF